MKRITVAVTVDDKMGVAFNKRRQSRDRLLIKDLCEKSCGKIYISNYSAPLFEGFEDRIIIVDDPIKDCEDGGLCFLEMTSLEGNIDNVEKLIVYQWNRLYPSDKKLGVAIEDCGFKMTAKYEFVGSSHDKITKGIYQK